MCAMTEAQLAVERLRKKHGSLRKAAQICGIPAPSLCRIKLGRYEPSDTVLAKLGLVRTIIYSRGNGKARK